MSQTGGGTPSDLADQNLVLELREINERLLISSLRQHELADIADRARNVLARALEREQAIAAALQYSILWEEPEDQVRGLSVATIYEPAMDEALVGGDFFDSIGLPSGNVLLVVGDVTGKGLKAAARTVEVKFALRAFAFDYEMPSDTVARLNSYLCQRRLDTAQNSADLIVIMPAVVNPIDGFTQLVSAGAEPPFIVRASGEIEEIPTRGLMLGFQLGLHCNQVDRTLTPGDVLVMTTDGLTEARRGVNFFGYERIAEIVQKSDRSASLHELGHTIVEAARAHAGGHFRDDVYILLVRRK